MDFDSGELSHDLYFVWQFVSKGTNVSDTYGEILLLL
jgi:hypothetical protein